MKAFADTRELFKPRYTSDTTNKPKVPVESPPKAQTSFNKSLFGHHNEGFTDPSTSTPQLGRGIDPKEGVTFNMRRATKRLLDDDDYERYNSKRLGNSKISRVPKFKESDSSDTKLSFSTCHPIHQAHSSSQSSNDVRSRSNLSSVRGRRPINGKSSEYQSNGSLPESLKGRLDANMANMDRVGSPTYSPRSLAKPLGRQSVPSTIKDAIDGDDDDVIEVDEVIDLEAEENNNGKKKKRQLLEIPTPEKFSIFRSKNGRSRGTSKR
jgi:hypothetical protein